MLNKSIYFAYSGLVALVLIVVLTACEQKHPKNKALSEKELI